MTPEVITVCSSDSLSHAARLMRDSDIGVLPIVDDGKVCGVVTDRDLVIRGLADGRPDACVGDVASGDVVCLAPDDDDKRAEALMSEHDVRRLPVVEDGRLVGMVSVGDLAVGASDKRAGKVMESTGPQW
ncbi:MAG: CBS domain-containing protein [Dehalococcoidia bacterium]|nr:CBS domain-containing protein [Dehalococcoidia bacterium]